MALRRCDARKGRFDSVRKFIFESPSGHIKLYALSQREGLPIVDGVRGPAHVTFPGVRSGFPTTASLLLTAEGAPYRRSIRRLGSRDLEQDDGESGIADQDGLDEQVPFRDWQGVGMV